MANFTQIDDAPPIFELMSEPTAVAGEHLNMVWRALACPYGSSEPGSAMIIKGLCTPISLATELACALAGIYLKLPIPAPCLVLCDPELVIQLPEDLRERSMKASDGSLIYFGSMLVFEHPIRPAATADPRIIERIWNKLCSNEVAPAGAAWDELVANPDRHHENMTFDGEQWWLYDHDKALAPLAELFARLAEVDNRNTIATHRASRNQIASEMERRRCNMAPIGQRSKLMSRGSRTFDLMVSVVQQWTYDDTRVQGVLTLTADVLRSIGYRLPAIELLVEQRINTREMPPLLWSD